MSVWLDPLFNFRLGVVLGAAFVVCIWLTAKCWEK